MYHDNVHHANFSMKTTDEDTYQVTVWDFPSAILTNTQWGCLRYDEWCGCEVERNAENGREAWVEEDGKGHCAVFCFARDTKFIPDVL